MFFYVFTYKFSGELGHGNLDLYGSKLPQNRQVLNSFQEGHFLGKAQNEMNLPGIYDCALGCQFLATFFTNTKRLSC